MAEKILEKIAIKQRIQGKKYTSVYCESERSKLRFFNWYYEDQSKSPRFPLHKISIDIRKLIAKLGIQAEVYLHAQIGTSAIKWEYKRPIILFEATGSWIFLGGF